MSMTNDTEYDDLIAWLARQPAREIEQWVRTEAPSMSREELIVLRNALENISSTSDPTDPQSGLAATHELLHSQIAAKASEELRQASPVFGDPSDAEPMGPDVPVEQPPVDDQPIRDVPMDIEASGSPASEYVPPVDPDLTLIDRMITGPPESEESEESGRPRYEQPRELTAVPGELLDPETFGSMVMVTQLDRQFAHLYRVPRYRDLRRTIGHLVPSHLRTEANARQINMLAFINEHANSFADFEQTEMWNAFHASYAKAIDNADLGDSEREQARAVLAASTDAEGLVLSPIAQADLNVAEQAARLNAQALGMPNALERDDISPEEWVALLDGVEGPQDLMARTQQLTTDAFSMQPQLNVTSLFDVHGLLTLGEDRAAEQALYADSVDRMTAAEMGIPLDGAPQPIQFDASGFGTGHDRPMSYYETLNMIYAMQPEQVEVLQDKLLEAGFFREAPTFRGDPHDQATNQAWRAFLLHAVHSGQPLMQVYEERSRQLRQLRHDERRARRDNLEVVYPDAAEMSFQLNQIAQRTIGRHLSWEERRDMMEYMRGLHREDALNRLAMDEGSVSTRSNVDITARVYDRVRTIDPEYVRDASAREVLGSMSRDLRRVFS